MVVLALFVRSVNSTEGFETHRSVGCAVDIAASSGGW